MGRLIPYDNENALQYLVDDSIMFIVAETKRIVEKEFPDADDPNQFVLVSQNITASFVLQILMKMHLNNDVHMLNYERRNQGGVKL